MPYPITPWRTSPWTPLLESPISRRRRSSAPLATQPRCGATKKTTGLPCEAPKLPGYNHCAFHSPELAEAVAAGREKGGYACAKYLPDDALIPSLATDSGAMELLDQVAKAVLTGKITPQIAQAVTGAVSTATRLAEARTLAALRDVEVELLRQKRERGMR